MKRRLARVAMALAAAWSAAVGCDDLSPLPYTPPPDASTNEAGPDGVAIAACRQCIQTTCAAEYGQCATAPKCKATMDCMTDTACWPEINIQNLTPLPKCAADCLAKSGATSSQDPALAQALPAFLCVTDAARCAGDCL